MELSNFVIIETKMCGKNLLSFFFEVREIHVCSYKYIFKENTEDVRNFDIVIIDICFANFEENALNILNLLNPSFHRRVTPHCSAYGK